jgi:hypothetical protein
MSPPTRDIVNLVGLVLPHGRKAGYGGPDESVTVRPSIFRRVPSANEISIITAFGGE